MNLLHHRLITHKSPPPSLMRKHHESMKTKNKNELNVPPIALQIFEKRVD